jgi:hypothetical protein
MSETFYFPEGKNHIKKTSFEGSAYFNFIVMYFLSHKHENCCVVFPDNFETDSKKSIHFSKDGKDHHIHDDTCVLLPKSLKDIPDEQRKVSLRWVEKKRKKSKKNRIITLEKILDNSDNGFISVPKHFWKNLNKCSGTNKRFIVFPFGYNCVDSGHANYMLYDKKYKTLERFESFGKVTDSCINPPDLDKNIFKLFVDNAGSDFIKEYHPPLSYLPVENFQTIQENEKDWINRNEDDEPVGYCAAWSAWYIDLRLSNPDIEKDKLTKMALKKLHSLPISFTEFIRNYSGLIVQVSNEINKFYLK